MFQKLLILMFIIFAWANIATAQEKKLKGIAVVTPKEVAGTYLDGVLEGKTKLKSGRELKWTLMYDKKELKPVSMIFDCPDDVNEEFFDADIQAMTTIQFWNGIRNCLLLGSNNATIECVITLQATALTDCARTGDDADCWMINR